MSNYYSRLFTQHSSQHEDSIFDRIGGDFSFKLSKNSILPTGGSSQVPVLECELICKNLCTNEMTEGLFSLHKNFLISHNQNKSSNSLLKVLDLSYSRLKATSPYLKYHITLTKNQVAYELTFPNKATWKAWTAHLERFCILTDFQEKYEIIEVSEKGKHSHMFAIKGKEDKSYYSAKAFNKKELLCSKNPILQMSLINQIETMRALNHKRIVQLVEIHETSDFVYLVTEYIHSQTLDKVLKNSKPQETSAKVIIFSLLKTLAYMASQGIVHRNIKPSNILLDDENRVKIAGFSLATFVNSKKTNFGACGTPGYIAPEVLAYEEKKDNQPYNDKCDVFSAGCIFFQLFFGYPLFQGSRATEIANSNRKVLRLDLTELVLKGVNASTNSQGLNLLFNLLERDPSKRISAKDALHHPYFHQPSKLDLNDVRDFSLNSIDDDILYEGSPKRQTRRVSFDACESADFTFSEVDRERSPSPLQDRVASNQVTVLELTPTASFPTTSKFSASVHDLELKSSKAKSTPLNLKPRQDSQGIQTPSMTTAMRSIDSLNSKKKNPFTFNLVPQSAYKDVILDESEAICDEDAQIHIQSRNWVNGRGG